MQRHYSFATEALAGAKDDPPQLTSTSFQHLVEVRSRQASSACFICNFIATIFQIMTQSNNRHDYFVWLFLIQFS